MAEIAILGYGVVGSGVVEVLEKNRDSIDKKAQQPIRVKYILDKKDFTGSPIEHLIVNDFDIILNDKDIKIVIEVMGGIEPAYTFVKSALLKGKSVVTSNKALVASHGPELLAIARKNNINFLFEASVGGGIPIIRPLNQSLTADEIYEITGILNGTTNFMLTQMTEKGQDFDDVLKIAQDLGYAERDPSADVEGYDTCRKIAILLSLAIGQQVDYEDIKTEGITKITKRHIQYAEALNGNMKLIANAIICDDKASVIVAPAVVTADNPLYCAKDVFNAICIKGNVIGEVMFYGQGAGKLPTASAVVADVVEASKHLNKNIMYFWSSGKKELHPMEDVKVNYFVIANEICKDKLMEMGYKDFVQLEEYPNEIGIIFNDMSENEIHNEIFSVCGKENMLDIFRIL